MRSTYAAWDPWDWNEEASGGDRAKKLASAGASLELETIFTFLFAYASALVITCIFPVERTMTRTNLGYLSGLFVNSLTDG